MNNIKEIIAEYAELNTAANELAAEIAALVQQKKALESRMLEIELDLKGQMLNAGMRRAQILGWKINLSNSTSTVIEAEDELPEAYWRIERKPNIMQIKEAFRCGVMVPGAKLITKENINLKPVNA